MGLDIVVGDFSECLIEDSEVAEELKIDYQKICDRLISLGFDGWKEPQTLPIKSEPSWFPYGCLSSLRLKFAYIKEGLGDIEFSEDNDFNWSVYHKWTIPSLHLMYYSQYSGYYIPVDFPEVIEIDNLGDDPLVGSSIRLLEELKEIALYLDICMDGDNLSEQEHKRIIKSFKTRKLTQKYWVEKVVDRLEWLTPIGIAMKLLKGNFENEESLDRLSIAKMVWLDLHEKARFSKIHKTAITFC